MGLQVSTECCNISLEDPKYRKPVDEHEYLQKEEAFWDQASTAFQSDYTRTSGSSIWSVDFPDEEPEGEKDESSSAGNVTEPTSKLEVAESSKAPEMQRNATPLPSCDARDEFSPESHDTVKLFILVHGMCGCADDWSHWIGQIKKRQRPDWIVIAAESITRHCGLLASGLEKLAALLSEEVSDILNKLLTASEDSALRADYCGSSVRRSLRRDGRIVLNFVGHSLGGLTTRAALPAICKLQAFSQNKFELGHFLSLNSPHLGICSASAATAWKSLARFGKLHRQLNLLDTQPGASCFLARLADPEDVFLKELLKFQHRTTVAGTAWDLLVPFCTAAISPSNPFPVTGPSQRPFWQVDAALDESLTSFDGKKAKLWQQEFARTALPEGTSCNWHCPQDSGVQFPESMYRGLTSVPWRRVAFTVHRTIGAQVHTFCLGKQQLSRRAKRWSLEFIDMLLDMLED